MFDSSNGVDDLSIDYSSQLDTLCRVTLAAISKLDLLTAKDISAISSQAKLPQSSILSLLTLVQQHSDSRSTLNQLKGFLDLLEDSGSSQESSDILIVKLPNKVAVFYNGELLSTAKRNTAEEHVAMDLALNLARKGNFRIGYRSFADDNMTWSAVQREITLQVLNTSHKSNAPH